MTYALSQSLQMAIYDRLAGDAALDALIGGAVYDAVPTTAPDLFVALGPERVRGRSDATASGAVHEVRISVVTTRNGFLDAKRVAGRVSDALERGTLTMTQGRVVSMRFLRARAQRDEGEATRRIDLWFRARTDEQS